MPKWDFVLATTDGEVLMDLTQAVGRSLTVSLNDAAKCSFSISGVSAEVKEIRELATDIIVYRDGVKMFRGRVGPSKDTLDETGHKVDYTVWDYREMLSRRILLGDERMAWTDTDQEKIGWDLIQGSQSKDYGDLGITRGSSQSTGVLRDIQYEAGASIGEAVQSLSELVNGFEWEITPDLVYKVHHPLRGDQNSAFVLDYGGSVSSLSRSVDPSSFANVVRVMGGEAKLPNPPVISHYYDLSAGGYFGPNEEYRYAVSAILPEGETKVSGVRNVRIDGSANAVQLRWSQVARATGYNVYGRNITKGPANVVPVVGATTGGTLASGRQLKYGVTAITPYGETDVTEANFSIPATGTNTNTVRVDWYPLPGATLYRLYGRDQNGTLQFIRQVSGPSATDDGTRLLGDPPPEPFPMRRIANNVQALNWVDTGESWPDGALPTGEPGVLSAVRIAGDLGSAGAGRVESNIADQSLLRQTTVNERASWYLDSRAVVRPSYSLTLAPGRWSGPDALWLGDRPTLDVVSGRLNINTRDLRVTEMKFSISDSGGETVDITLGYRPRNIFERIHRVSSNLERIARH